MNNVRMLVVLVLTTALAASATAPSTHAVNTTATVAASYEATWTAVLDLFAENNWAILNLDKDSGLVTTDWMRIEDKYADCGNAPLLTTDQTSVRFNVRVKSDEGSSEVAVNASFRQLRSFDGKSHVVDCTTNGTVEGFIHRMVDSRAFSNDKRKAKKQERAAKAEQAAPPIFYCTEAPADANLSACARSQAGCSKRQADIVALAGDATPCVEHKGAVCFKGKSPDGVAVESCHPTFTACEKQYNKVVSDPDAMNDVSACAAI
ncbi:MAG: hypothetical protein JWP01_425 [Myxococcales bacterium]|nr:hypothetical protein [Myxococcales bacterium]